MIVCFKRITTTAMLPTRAYDTDAGIDFYADEDMTIDPRTRDLVPTGLIWEPREFPSIWNVYMKIQERSGLALKNGIEVLGGTIDEQYRGEIKIIILNMSSSVPFVIKRGDKIAQGVVYYLPKFEIQDVDDVSQTARGAGGFGSTGNKA
jgi:dUTP pyrophosphatase